MSSLEQIEDNMSTFGEEQALSTDDMELLIRACDQFRSQIQITCTACRYCCSGCPMGINITDYLKIYNDYKVSGEWTLSGLSGVQSKGKTADCIGYSACSSHCPQSIKIPELMTELVKLSKMAQ